MKNPSRLFALYIYFNLVLCD